MAPLFSKVDLYKLWHDVQNEENLIFAKFGKDLFNISKVIGRKKVAQFFWLTVYYGTYSCNSYIINRRYSHSVFETTATRTKPSNESIMANTSNATTNSATTITMPTNISLLLYYKEENGNSFSVEMQFIAYLFLVPTWSIKCTISALELKQYTTSCCVPVGRCSLI